MQNGMADFASQPLEAPGKKGLIALDHAAANAGTGTDVDQRVGHLASAEVELSEGGRLGLIVHQPGAVLLRQVVAE